MKKIIYLASLLVIFSMLLPACSTGQNQLHPVKGDFIEGQLLGDAQTLNWMIATDGGLSRRYAGFVVDPLGVFDNQFKLQLRCLAKDIEVSADGLTYTVTVRNDLTWTDGTPVSAEDYVYTIKNLILADWINSADRSRWQETVDGKPAPVDAKTLGGNSFQIMRKTVDPDFLYTIYELMPYPKHIAVHYEKNTEAFTNAPEFNNLNYAGNLGPYGPVAWNTQSGFVLKRNPTYYLGKETGAPYFDSYTIKPYGLQQLANDAMTKGEVSMISVEPQDANSFRGMSDVNVYTVPTGYYVYMAYNQRDNGWAGLKDARVRQALSMAISKPIVIQSMYLGFADPAYSFIPPFSPLYDESVLNKFGMDPEADQQKAIDLIKAAGYEYKDVGGMMKFVDKDGNPIKLNFLVDIQSDFEQNLAIVIRQSLLSIGLDINPAFSARQIIFQEGLMNKVPDTGQDPAFNNGPRAVSNKPWDLVILSSHANPLSLLGSGEFFTSKGKFNVFGFYNDRADELYRRAGSAEAVSFEGRKKIYSELSKLISDEQPVDFLCFYKDNYAFRKNVKGVDPGIFFLNTYQFWYFE